MKKEQLLEYLQKTADQVNRTMADDIGIDGRAGIRSVILAELLENALLSGGKRVRPVLCVTAATLCGRKDADVYLLAASLEYLHAASLLHDDIIDGAELRRGRPATHCSFGTTPAILAGDFLHARAMGIAGDLGGTRCLHALGRSTAAMIHGEFMQMAHTGDPQTGEAEYRTIIRGKTAALLEAACEIGAIYAGASDKKQQALRRYGHELGMAFQMVDDLLDYLGDPAITGKPLGTDLGEGKATLPFIHALGNADSNDAGKLERLFNKAAKDPETIREAAKVIDTWDGFHYTREQAEEHGRNAMAALSCFSPGAEETTFLAGMVQYVLQRTR